MRLPWLCNPARLQQTQILTRSGNVNWQAKGQVVEFAGYAKYWQNLTDDAELPLVRQGQQLPLLGAGSDQKQTQPPPRYTEPKLVRQMERSGIGRPSTYAPTVATLKQRDYVEVVKSKLQPTTLGMEVDEFVGQALPKLVDLTFTAEMEDQLDQVASGKLDWQRWLTGWNRDYLVPALNQAQRLVSTLAHAPTTKDGKALVVSEVVCPQCQKPLLQVPSKKVSQGYFLKCQSCPDTVLFWSDRTQTWEAPKPKSESGSGQLTKYPCPVCQKPLEEHHYQKEGQDKVMLRCSDAVARQKPKHKEAVYFQTEQGFWSPKFGNLSVGGADAKVELRKTLTTVPRKRRSKSTRLGQPQL